MRIESILFSIDISRNMNISIVLLEYKKVNALGFMISSGPCKTINFPGEQDIFQPGFCSSLVAKQSKVYNIRTNTRETQCHHIKISIKINCN